MKKVFHDEARWLLRSCHKCLETFPVTECHGDCCAACFETIQREVGDDLRLHDALRQQEAMAWDGRRHYGLKKASMTETENITSSNAVAARF